MDQVLALFANNAEHMIDRMAARVVDEQIEPYDTMPANLLKQMITTVVKTFESDLGKQTPTAFPAYWASIAHSRALQGIRISTLLYLINIGNTVLNESMLEVLSDDLAGQVWWSQQLYAIIYNGVVGLSQAFITAHETIISEQATQIRALATPIVPMYTGILVLPIVGNINTERANQIMEDLLAEIVAMQADMVLIDITGVAIIDTGVANYMLQMARATQLLGAQVILVGISAEVAQTIVQLGVDLGGGRAAQAADRILERQVGHPLRSVGNAVAVWRGLRAVSRESSAVEFRIGDVRGVGVQAEARAQLQAKPGFETLMDGLAAVGHLELAVAVGRDDLVIEVHAEHRELVIQAATAATNARLDIDRTLGIELLIVEAVQRIAVERG